MRVSAIRNYQSSAYIRKLNKNLRNNTPESTTDSIKNDGVSFKRAGALKGIGIGAILGLGAVGALSALSGGLAAPAAYGLYAAVFGTTGGFAGEAIDEIRNNQ